MTERNCVHCPAMVECAVNGRESARRIRERITILRAALAVVSKCPKRKKWDGKARKR